MMKMNRTIIRVLRNMTARVDIDGTVLDLHANGDIVLTVLGHYIIDHNIPVRFLTVNPHWDIAKMEALGFNVAELRVAIFGQDLDMDEDGNFVKTINEGDTLIDDAAFASTGKLIRV